MVNSPLPIVPIIKNFVVVAENVDFLLKYPCEDSVISTLSGLLFDFFMLASSCL